MSTALEVHSRFFGSSGVYPPPLGCAGVCAPVPAGGLDGAPSSAVPGGASVGAGRSSSWAPPTTGTLGLPPVTTCTGGFAAASPSRGSVPGGEPEGSAGVSSGAGSSAAGWGASSFFEHPVATRHPASHSDDSQRPARFIVPPLSAPRGREELPLSRERSRCQPPAEDTMTRRRQTLRPSTAKGPRHPSEGLQSAEPVARVKAPRSASRRKLTSTPSIFRVPFSTTVGFRKKRLFQLKSYRACSAASDQLPSMRPW